MGATRFARNSSGQHVPAVAVTARWTLGHLHVGDWDTIEHKILSYM